MKVLTVFQPWASLIVHGLKTTETRSRETDYRGPLAIHAGRTMNSNIEHFCHTLSAEMEKMGYTYESLPRGQVVGVVQLVGCEPTQTIVTKMALKLTSFLLKLGDYRPGRYGWVLERPIAFPDGLPLVGRQGLIDLEKDAAIKVWARVLANGWKDEEWVAAANDFGMTGLADTEVSRP